MSIFRPLSALVPLGVAFLVGCTPAPNQEQQAAAAEQAVLAQHDSLMARMGELYELRQQLQNPQNLDTAATRPQRRALLAANDAMMDWMHHYQKPADSVAAAHKIAYFTGQQHKIDSIGQLMTRSIDSGRRVLAASSSPSSSAK